MDAVLIGSWRVIVFDGRSMPMFNRFVSGSLFVFALAGVRASRSGAHADMAASAAASL